MLASNDKELVGKALITFVSPGFSKDGIPLDLTFFISQEIGVSDE